MNKILLYSGFGYVVNLIFIPILTRFYSPEDMGYYGIFSTAVMLLIPILTLGNDYGVLNERSVTKSRRYLVKSAFAAVCLTLVIFILVVLIRLSTQLIPIEYNFLLLFPFVAFLAVLGGLGVSWLLRVGSEAVAGRALFVSMSCRSVFQSFFGLLGMPLGGLVLGEIIGRIIAIYSADKNFVIFRRFFAKINSYEMIATGLSRYSMYVTPKLFLDNFIIWSPPFFVALIYGPEMGGLMTIVQRLGGMPVTLFNQSIGLIFHRSLVLDNSKNLLIIRKKMITYWCFLLFISSMCGIVLYHFSEAIFSKMFGDEWTDAGHFLLLCLPMYTLQTCGVLCEKIFLYLNHLKIMLAFNIAISVVIVCAFCFSYIFEQAANQAISFMGLSVAAVYIASMILVLFIVDKD